MAGSDGDWRPGWRDRLPLPAYLAVRYLKSARRDAFATFLSLVAGVGIALGVAALILVLAVLAGFQGALRDAVLARSPEVEIALPLPAAAGDAEAIAALVRRTPGVEAVQRLVRGQGWLLQGDRVEPAPVALIGFETAVPRAFPGAAGKPPGLYLSSTLAAAWGLEPGDRVSLATPRPTLTPFGPQPRTRNLALAGTFEGSPTEQRERVALPLEVAESLLGSDRPRLDVAVVGGLARAPAVARRLSLALAAEFPGARVESWRELNRPLLFALKLEKVVTFVAVALVVLVASLALVADLSLIISSKRREIGMLLAMGAGRQAIRTAFLLLGGMLAGAGVALGALIGVPGAWLADRYELFAVPDQVYLVDHVPFHVAPWDLTVVLVMTAVLALASSFYAARRATVAGPVEALRR
jgi:lipoprotein-releasing system permease protein